MKKQYITPELSLETLPIPDSMIASDTQCVGQDGVTEAYWPDGKPKYNYMHQAADGKYYVCDGY